MVARTTPFAAVIVVKSYSVGDAQVGEYMLQCRRCVVEDYLLVGCILFAALLNVVMPEAHEAYLSTTYRETLITVVDVFCSVQNVANGVARQSY